ncbi:MAG: HlyD family secretion protein [Kiritimatiellia bacterium]
MDNVYQKPRLRRPLRQLVRSGASVVFGLLVLAASALVLVWLFGREQEVRFHGIVDAGAENVGPVESARIVSVEVVPGQTVAAGDVLVRFDSTARLMELALNEVKIRECEQGATRFRTELQDSERRGRQLVREADVALEECRMERLREEAELAGLEAEIARLTPLVRQKLVSELELTALRPKADALRRTVGGYEPLLGALAKRLEQAKENLKEIRGQIAALDARSTETNATLLAALRRYEDLQRTDASVLRALSNGVVSQVFRRAGDIVPEGEAIVRVASAPDARTVTGMLPSDLLDSVHPGDELIVSRVLIAGRGTPPVTVTGRVETVDPEVLDFFDPMNSAPRAPARGRKVRIRLMGDAAAFIPGETVLITSGGAGGLDWLFEARKGGGL